MAAPGHGKRALSIFILLLFAGCHQREPAARSRLVPPTTIARTPVAPVVSEDAILLNSVLTRKGTALQPGYTYLVERETIPLKHIDFWISYDMLKRKHPQKEFKEAYDDFVRRNTAICVTPALTVSGPLLYRTRNEINATFARDSWQGFHKKFPHAHGIVELSLPGYSVGHATALVYTEISWGPLAALGAVMLLEKKAGKWTIKDTLTGWRS